MKEGLRPYLDIDFYETDRTAPGDDRAKVLFVEFDWLGIYINFAIEIARPRKSRR